MKMRKLVLFGGWAKPMAVESSSVAEPATGIRAGPPRALGGRDRNGKCFDQTVARILSDAIHYGDVLGRWLDGYVSGLIRDGRGERGTGDFLIGARGGIGDLIHVNAVSADGEKDSGLGRRSPKLGWRQ